jgi:hypothetical protein
MSKEDVVWSMAREILDLRMAVINREVGSGNCPHAMYPLEGSSGQNCGDLDCRTCHAKWYKKKKREVAKEIMIKYGLER